MSSPSPSPSTTSPVLQSGMPHSPAIMATSAPPIPNILRSPSISTSSPPSRSPQRSSVPITSTPNRSPPIYTPTSFPYEMNDPSPLLAPLGGGSQTAVITEGEAKGSVVIDTSPVIAAMMMRGASGQGVSRTGIMNAKPNTERRGSDQRGPGEGGSGSGSSPEIGTGNGGRKARRGTGFSTENGYVEAWANDGLQRQDERADRVALTLVHKEKAKEKEKEQRNFSLGEPAIALSADAVPDQNDLISPDKAMGVEHSTPRPARAIPVGTSLVREDDQIPRRGSEQTFSSTALCSSIDDRIRYSRTPNSSSLYPISAYISPQIHPALYGTGNLGSGTIGPRSHALEARGSLDRHGQWNNNARERISGGALGPGPDPLLDRLGRLRDLAIQTVARARGLMKSNRNPIHLLTGNSHPALADAIAERLGIPLTPCKVSKFSARETSVQINASVRDEDVFILQSPSPPSINDHLMELLIMISACKTASAKRITAVIPCYPYSRQDKKDKSRAPITSKLVANLLQVAGADHVITMDLHASQIQGFFDIPCDNLFCEPTIVSYIKSEIDGWRDAVIVSPDAGGAKRATALADRLNLEFALINRKRKRDRRKDHQPGGPMEHLRDTQSVASTVPGTPTGFGHSSIQLPSDGNTSAPYGRDSWMSMNSSFHIGMNMNGSTASLIGPPPEDDDRPENMELLVGDVKGKTAILVDDMIDTGHTVRLAAEVLRDAGAKEIYVLISHGLLSDVTDKFFRDLPVKKLIVTNTIDQTKRVECSGGVLGVIDIAPVLAESIRRTHNGESISALFRSEPY